MKRTKAQRGITLIALIITIIVLLILAVVAIRAVTGEGIIKKAQLAKDKTQFSSLKEEVELVLMKRKLDREQGELKELRNDLENGISGNKQLEEVTEAFYITRDGATITVYKDETIEDRKFDIWDGTSKGNPQVDEQNNWHIYTPAQMKFFADFVNGALTEEEKGTLTITADTVVYLENNLDLGARQQNGEKTAGTTWESIGKSTNKFEGIFDGQNHTIKGVYVKQSSNFAGLFGYSSNTIRNLTIKDSYVEGYSGTGAIVGYANIVENCNNQNTKVTSSKGSYNYIGGVVGYGIGTIKKCKNTGEILGIGTNGSCGGIVGAVKSSVEQCENAGIVIGYGNHVGGIGGAIKNEANYCTNSGSVEGKNQYTGGIVGSSGANITGCINTGPVKGKSHYVGGISALFRGDQTNPSATISECINTGNITGEAENVGGIIGGANSCSTILNCMNSGPVSASKYAGGIVGQLLCNSENKTNSTVSLCYNSGAINAQAYIGGIIGKTSGSVGNTKAESCYSKGMIEGTSYKGAIIGNRKGTNTLQKLYYLNSVGVGALNGNDDETNKIMSTTEDISYEQFKEWINSK